jgi:hypothetical protein
MRQEQAAEILSRLSRLSFLFWDVQRGYVSFQRERSKVVKADELLISAKDFPAEADFRLPITAQ